MKSKPASGPAPTEASLREAALHHLGRYEATRAGLIRVLDRRIARWAMRSEDPERAADAVAPMREAARRVADGLVAIGALDDSRFAERRAALHARTGRSARSSRAMLGVLGVPPALADEASARDADLELEAAVLHARKRRLGPFARPLAEDADPRRAQARAFGSLARAGFSAATARAALDLPLTEAEAMIARLRARD
jgi:regulatory protein